MAAKKSNVHVNKGSYPFAEKGGSHSKSRAPQKHSGAKDPRKGPAHNISQPQQAQTNSPSPNDGSDLTMPNPMSAIVPREQRAGGFRGLRSGGM